MFRCFGSGLVGGFVPGRAFFWVWEVFISCLVLRNVGGISRESAGGVGVLAP